MAILYQGSAVPTRVSTQPSYVPPPPAPPAPLPSPSTLPAWYTDPASPYKEIHIERNRATDLLRGTDENGDVIFQGTDIHDIKAKIDAYRLPQEWFMFPADFRNYFTAAVGDYRKFSYGELNAAYQSWNVGSDILVPPSKTIDPVTGLPLGEIVTSPEYTFIAPVRGGSTVVQGAAPGLTPEQQAAALILGVGVPAAAMTAVAAPFVAPLLPSLSTVTDKIGVALSKLGYQIPRTAVQGLARLIVYGGASTAAGALLGSQSSASNSSGTSTYDQGYNAGSTSGSSYAGGKSSVGYTNKFFYYQGKKIFYFFTKNGERQYTLAKGKPRQYLSKLLPH